MCQVVLRVAICPLCQAELPLGAEGMPHRDEAVLVAHASKHTLREWLAGTQELRTELDQTTMLRDMPRCAMAQA